VPIAYNYPKLRADLETVTREAVTREAVTREALAR